MKKRGRAPRGARGLKQIVGRAVLQIAGRRAPRGARGLKLPRPCYRKPGAEVAPREGRVD